jgi:hypothetical protein
MTPFYMVLETINETEARAWNWHTIAKQESKVEGFDMPAGKPFDLDEAARSNGLQLIPGKTWERLALCYDPKRDDAVALVWETGWWWLRRLPTELLWGWSLLDDPRE